MLVCSLLFALALLFGCERRSRTIHAASWKPWLMGTDRLVVRSAPAPGHGKNRGFPAALQHPRLPHCSQSCGRAREPQPRRPWQPAASWGPVSASPKPCVCLFACLSPCACPAARSPPAAAQVPQCPPFPAAARKGTERAGRRPGLLCPQRPGCCARGRSRSPAEPPPPQPGSPAGIPG